MSLVLGIDIGGTGSRAALADTDSGSVAADPGPGATAAGLSTRVINQFSGPRVEIGPTGSTVLHVVRRLLETARESWPQHIGRIAGIGIGATGIASLAADPTPALAEISGEFGVPVAAAIDAVTAHLGALGGSGGAISVLGTGAIAIAHPGPDHSGAFTADWSRADGWGHLFGDRGGGAWLGRRGLELALRTHDGVDSAGGPLLEAATARFGPPASWPGQFYTRNDRAGLLADFAEAVADLARSGDPAAVELIAEAGREAARSAVAAARSSAAAVRRSAVTGESNDRHHSATGAPLRIVLTGGLTRAGDILLDAFRQEANRLSDDVVVDEPAGDPLAGALTLARLGAGGRLRAQAGVLWV